MKPIALLASIFLPLALSVSASADSQQSFLVAEHKTFLTTIELPPGSSRLAVQGTHNELISCVVIDRGSGKIAYEAIKTHVCLGNADLTLPEAVDLGITNETNSTIKVSVAVDRR